MDRFAWVCLAALAALAFAPLIGMLVRVWTQGGIFTGADSYLVADPMQYVNWLRQAGDHVGVANLYDLAPGPHSFVHPGLVISGLAHRLGLGIIAAYMIWKPVAVVALFAGALATVRRFLDRSDDRRLALVLALFACMPVAAAVSWSGLAGVGTKIDFDFISGELWTGSYVWGYLFTGVAVGLLPLSLLAYERGRRGGPGGMLVWAAAGGLVCAWLQPWQGISLALVVVAAEALSWPRERRGLGPVARGAVPMLVAIAGPLVYYLILSRTDPSWELAGVINDIPRWPWWVTVLGLAPLAIPAAFAYRLPAPDFGALALRAWPLAGLLVFYQPAGTFPFHAFQGLTLPLAVLGVVALRGWLGERPVPLWPAVAAVVILVVPGTVHRVDELRGAVKVGRQAFFLEPGERDALRWLERAPQPGGVLATAYSGVIIPAYTGRETWIGAGSWTPDGPSRGLLTESLFSGRVTRAQAEGIVRRSGARFVYVDCHDRADLTSLISGVTGRPRRFGCATVYEVRGA